MNKIKKYLFFKDFDITFIKTEKFNFVGGKSFDNDGTFKIDIYKVLGNGETFYIFVKVTGKSFYYIGYNSVFDDVTDVFLTQKDLVLYLKDKY